MTLIPSGRLLVRNTLWNLLGQALPLVAALTAMPYVLHGFGAARFGVLSLIWVVLSVLTVFDFGLSRATTKLVAEALAVDDQSRAHGTIWSTLALQAALGVVGMLIMAACAPAAAARLVRVPPELLPEVRWSLLALSVAIPLHLGYSSLRGALEAAQRFDLVTIVRSPLIAGNFLVPAIGVFFAWSLPVTVAMFAGIRVLALVTVAAQCGHVFPGLWRRPQPSRQDSRAVLGFGAWVAVSSVVSPTLVYIDRLTLGMLLPVAALGHYSVAHETVTRLGVIPSSVVGTLYPAFSAIDGAGHRDRLERLASRSIKYLLFVLGPITIGLSAFAPRMLSLWMGAAVADSTSTALRILSIGVLLNGLAYVPFALLQGIGRPDLTAKTHLLELPVQLLIVLVFVKFWGISGAAAAWTLRVTLDALILYLLAFRTTSISMRALVAARLPRTIATLIIVASLSLAVAESGWSALGQGTALALCALPAVALSWFWLLDQSERAEIIGALTRYRASMAT